MWEDEYLASVVQEFRRYQALADQAIARLGAGGLTFVPDGQSNSILVLMKHVGGNLRSRWTDVLTSDGEKPDRHRDGEFESSADEEGAVRALWQVGWRALFTALEEVGPSRLGAVVTIRGEPHTLVRAIERSLAHTAYHTGQIVYLAKHLCADEWQSLSIARGQSARYAQQVRRAWGDAAALQEGETGPGPGRP